MNKAKDLTKEPARSPRIRVGGYALLARMALPVIMATGALPMAVFTGCPWLQPNATLLKPYTTAELLRTVKKVLREADVAGAGPELLMDRTMKDNQMLPACEPASAPVQHPTNLPSHSRG